MEEGLEGGEVEFAEVGGGDLREWLVVVDAFEGGGGLMVVSEGGFDLGVVVFGGGPGEGDFGFAAWVW